MRKRTINGRLRGLELALPEICHVTIVNLKFTHFVHCTAPTKGRRKTFQQDGTCCASKLGTIKWTDFLSANLLSNCLDALGSFAHLDCVDDRRSTKTYCGSPSDGEAIEKGAGMYELQVRIGFSLESL